jgi:hypothetical protein
MAFGKTREFALQFSRTVEYDCICSAFSPCPYLMRAVYSSFPFSLINIRGAKRIQIFFRGTETSRKTKDVGADAKFWIRQLAITPLLKEIIEDNAEANSDSPLVDKNGQAITSLPVHCGFYGKLRHTKK